MSGRSAAFICVVFVCVSGVVDFNFGLQLSPEAIASDPKQVGDYALGPGFASRYVHGPWLQPLGTARPGLNRPPFVGVIPYISAFLSRVSRSVYLGRHGELFQLFGIALAILGTLTRFQAYRRFGQ